MDYKIFNLKIDLGRESRNAVKPVQGESAVKLRATLTHNSQPYNLTDATVRCLFRKPDHTYSYIDAVVIDAAKGIVEIELTNQVLLLSGSVVAAIEVAGTIGIAKTWLFTMDVQPGIPYTDIESVDEFPAVEQMIIDIAEIKANFNAIVAGVTVDGEVILARAGFTTLGERIDDLATKVNTTIPAQLNDIEQDKAEKTDVGLLSGLLTTAKTSIVNAINELFNNKANKAQEAWITPTLLNGWTQITGQEAAYMKDTLGFVHFKGTVTTGTLSSVIFNLPAGYKPAQPRSFPTMANGLFGRINVSTAGTVVFAAGSASVVYLDGITYKGEI